MKAKIASTGVIENLSISDDFLASRFLKTGQMHKAFHLLVQVKRSTQLGSQPYKAFYTIIIYMILC